MKFVFFLLATFALFAKEPHPITKVNEWCKDEKNLTEGRYFTFATLATISPDGFPHARIVAITHFHKEKGALFFTHKNTNKVTHLTFNPHASLNLWLPKTHKQVTIDGRVEEIPRNEVEKSWNRMSRFMKLTFIASNHTGELESEEILQKRKKLLEKEFPKEIPIPSTFIGYRLAPSTIVFVAVHPRSFATKEIATIKDNKWVTVLLEP